MKKYQVVWSNFNWKIPHPPIDQAAGHAIMSKSPNTKEGKVTEFYAFTDAKKAAKASALRELQHKFPGQYDENHWIGSYATEHAEVTVLVSLNNETPKYFVALSPTDDKHIWLEKGENKWKFQMERDGFDLRVTGEYKLLRSRGLLP